MTANQYVTEPGTSGDTLLCATALYCRLSTHRKVHKPNCEQQSPKEQPVSQSICWPSAAFVPVPRSNCLDSVTGMTRQQVQQCLAASQPLIFGDFQDGWQAAHMWSFDYFASQCGSATPIVNNLAPMFDKDEGIVTLR